MFLGSAKIVVSDCCFYDWEFFWSAIEKIKVEAETSIIRLNQLEKPAGISKDDIVEGLYMFSTRPIVKDDYLTTEKYIMKYIKKKFDNPIIMLQEIIGELQEYVPIETIQQLWIRVIGTADIVVGNNENVVYNKQYYEQQIRRVFSILNERGVISYEEASKTTKILPEDIKRELSENKDILLGRKHAVLPAHLKPEYKKQVFWELDNKEFAERYIKHIEKNRLWGTPAWAWLYAYAILEQYLELLRNAGTITTIQTVEKMFGAIRELPKQKTRDNRATNCWPICGIWYAE